MSNNEDTITVDGNSRGDNSDIHWGGDRGNGGNGGNNSGSTSPGVNLSKTPEAQATVAFGAPAALGVIDGIWGFTLSSNIAAMETLQALLAKIEQSVVTAAPFAGRLLGATFAAIYPSPLAKDNPRMMATAHIINTLPASQITATPVSALPTQHATVVHTQIADVVLDDGKQHLAVIRSRDLSYTVPVIEAKPTKRAGVFTAAIVPGKPDLHISIGTGNKTTVSQSSGIQKEQGETRYPGFTSGSRTHDAIIHFPGNKTSPVYISVTEVLTESEARKQAEEERQRQQQWDERHPVEVAERQNQAAAKAVVVAQENVNQQQATLNKLQRTTEGLVLSNPGQYPISYQKKVTAHVKGASQSYILILGPFEIKSNGDLDKLLNKGATAFDPIPQGVNPAQTSGDGYEVAQTIRRLTIAEYDALRTRIIARRNEIAAAQTALNSALESRKQKEQEKLEAENKLEDEKNKSKGKIPDIKFDGKIKNDMRDRGWTEQDVKDTVAEGGKGKSLDQRRPIKTEDGLGRNDPATVYGEPGKYVVINDRTGEVTQVSGKNKPGWIDDSRIQWGE